MNNENNTNQTNNQNVVPNITVSNDTTQSINVVNDTSTIPVVNDVEDGSMKSGTMTCTLTKDNTDNLSTIYDTTFTYTKNKLKKTEQVTSYKLKDDATSTDTLDDSENECQNLKSVLTGVTGIDVSCAKTAVLQKTTQVIDYTKFNAEEITTNIAEYKGFYPEYQLDQSIADIRKNLEESGYSCQAREYVD